jgi:hypothetical protein
MKEGRGVLDRINMIMRIDAGEGFASLKETSAKVSF